MSAPFYSHHTVAAFGLDNSLTRETAGILRAMERLRNKPLPTPRQLAALGDGLKAVPAEFWQMTKMQKCIFRRQRA